MARASTGADALVQDVEHTLSVAQRLFGEIPFLCHWYDAGWVRLFIDCAGLTTRVTTTGHALRMTRTSASAPVLALAICDLRNIL